MSGEAASPGASAPTLVHAHVDAPEPFVGRARELDRFCRAAESVRLSGRGHVVVVSGEAGMGKTRLCTEVAARAREAGMRVVEARCWLDGWSPPLWPWQPILRELCGDAATGLLASGADVADVGPDRFARFVAVTDRLAGACTASPVCLVVDDVHAADYGALLLIRFVARSLAGVPLLLVLGRRTGEPAGDGEAARLLDEVEREATPVVLTGFDRADTATFLAVQGVGGLSPDLVAALHRLTRGNPLHLRQVAQATSAGGTEPDLGGGLRPVIERAFGALSGASRRVLSLAAVLGPDPLVAETAAVAGCDAAAVLDAVDEGAAAGLVSAAGGGRLAFDHDLVRRAVEHDLGAADRLDAHARAASVVLGDDDGEPTIDRLARAAHHASAAAPRSTDDARRAVDVCESAAQAMVRNFAYEQADTLFTAAVELHATSRLGTPPALLALQWAQAAALRGHMSEARDRFGTAVTTAEAEGRPGLLAEAALGWGGVWLDDYPSAAEKVRMLGLYATALDGLPRDPAYDAQRCRLRVRLAAEAVFEGGPGETLDAAMAAARATGDPRCLAESLSLAHHALFTPEHAPTWPALTDELVEVTSETDLGVLALVGLLWRTVDLLHLGDPGFIRALEVLRERASVLGNDHMLYHVAVVDVLVAIGQGRLADAEAATHRCRTRGEQIGRADATAYWGGQLATVRWLQGRDAEMLEEVGEMAASPALSDTDFSGWALAACLAARSGQHDEARAFLNHGLPPKLTELAPSGTWMVGVVAIVEAAAALGDRELAAQAYDLLAPHAGLPAVGGLGMICLGSNERALGVAAGVLGRHDRAVEHLERALVANRRLVNRSLLTLSRAELAAALLRRNPGCPDVRARAADLLDRAVADGTAFGMTARVARWEAELAELRRGAGAAAAPPPNSTPPAPPALPAADRAPPGVIRRDGQRWTIAVGDRRIRVANLVGMRYLADLLTSPGQRIPAVTLVGKLNDPAPAPRQEILDDRARTSYATRARELTADLAEAEAANDLHRAERIRLELDVLVDELEAATGINGRPRHFSDDHERARVAVQKAIKRAIAAIGDADPALADDLRLTISTGVTCCYTPSAESPVSWTSRRQ